VQSVDEGLRDAANLAWKLAMAWHEVGGIRGPRVDRDALETLLDSYETERRGAVGARLRAVDQAMPLVRREGGALRAMLPGGGARTPLELLTDGHLGRGLLGAPATYRRSPLAPSPSSVDTVFVDTPPGAPVDDVPVIALNGERGRLRDRLCGMGGELLVVLVAPGTGVWDSRHWLSAGMMPELAAAVRALPLKAELVVTERYPGATAHTVLVIRPDGHLVAALPGPRTEQLRACADAVRGGTLPEDRPATTRKTGL
ncbi:MAG TPA: monooxygenase, partial [Streptomyces sp.]|jgi:3-(3-hydroxy-phenyl)propionate hydroxylase|nr:monooxygenase [Streptomyces sp.]